MNKGDFVISRRVLYHKDKVEEQTIVNSVYQRVSVCRYYSWLTTLYLVASLGNVKPERERERLSFYWPRMRQNIQDYVRSCAQCQLRSKTVRTDHVPIMPITLAELPFQVINMDCIGPLDPGA